MEKFVRDIIGDGSRLLTSSHEGCLLGGDKECQDRGRHRCRGPLPLCGYAILWAAGIPIGLSEEFYAEGLRIGMWHSGLSLAVAALVGGLLTLGLVQSWGERLPRWAGPVGGRRVPIPVATIPATLVTVVVFTGGVGLVRETLLGAVNMTGNFGGLWATVGPTWLFPIWALALGWATHRYRRRRLEAHT